MPNINIGDTALIDPILVRDRNGVLTDADTFTCTVLQPNGTTFSLLFGTAPTSGSGDAVIRRSVGTYAVQIEITPTRGDGLYRGSIATTGARAAEPLAFRVRPLTS